MLQFPLWLKAFSKSSHWYGFSFVWIFLWAGRVESWVNSLVQSSQQYGFSPVWIHWWTWRSESCMKPLGQILHLKGLSLLVSDKLWLIMKFFFAYPTFIWCLWLLFQYDDRLVPRCSVRELNLTQVVLRILLSPNMWLLLEALLGKWNCCPVFFWNFLDSSESLFCVHSESKLPSQDPSEAEAPEI